MYYYIIIFFAFLAMSSFAMIKHVCSRYPGLQYIPGCGWLSGCVFYGSLVVVTLPKHVFPFPGIVFKLSFWLITSVTITLMISCWMVIPLLLLLRSWTRLKPAFPITIKDTMYIIIIKLIVTHSKIHHCCTDSNYITQGVLAFKFPISILMRTQVQHRCQKIRNIVKNYVPFSDFATRPPFQCTFCTSLGQQKYFCMKLQILNNQIIHGDGQLTARELRRKPLV